MMENKKEEFKEFYESDLMKEWLSNSISNQMKRMKEGKPAKIVWDNEK